MTSLGSLSSRILTVTYDDVLDYKLNPESFSMLLFANDGV